VPLDHVKAGKVLGHAAPELLRVWRLARATARPQVFPGLLDGLMGDFLRRAARLLQQGAAPEEVWSGACGTLRWSADAGADEMTAEWALALEVISAAIDSADFDPAIGAWLARAVASAEAATGAMRGPSAAPAPPGVLLVKMFSSLARPQRGG
jgi:hypothetical protein